MAGVNVRAYDARTGQLLRQEATVLVRDGAYADSARGDLGLIGLAWERPGTYRVRVRSPGYREWTADSVLVREGRCHIEAARVDARLEPEN